MTSIVPPYKSIESWLIRYDEWKSEIAIIQEKLDNITGLTAHYELVPIHGEGGTNDRIFHQVFERLKIKERELPVLKSRIRLLDKAIQGLNEEERKFVELKYRQQIGNFYIMSRLEWTHRIFYERRKEILAKIYRLLGEDAEIWFA